MINLPFFYCVLLKAMSEGLVIFMRGRLGGGFIRKDDSRQSHNVLLTLATMKSKNF